MKRETVPKERVGNVTKKTDHESNRKRKERTLLEKEICKERWKERKRDGRRKHKKMWRKEVTGDGEAEPEPRRGPRGGPGRGREEPWKPGAFPGLGASPGPGFSDFPQRTGNPGKPLWAPFVCSRPGSADAVDLVFKQWVCSLLGWGRGLLAILKPADWIEFRPL